MMSFAQDQDILITSGVSIEQRHHYNIRHFHRKNLSLQSQNIAQDKANITTSELCTRLSNLRILHKSKSSNWCQEFVQDRAILSISEVCTGQRFVTRWQLLKILVEHRTNQLTDKLSPGQLLGQLQVQGEMASGDWRGLGVIQARVSSSEQF